MSSRTWYGDTKAIYGSLPVLGGKQARRLVQCKRREVWLVSRSVSKSVTACMRVTSAVSGRDVGSTKGICAATRANCILPGLITDRLDTKNLTETIRLSRARDLYARNVSMRGNCCATYSYTGSDIMHTLHWPHAMSRQILASLTVRCFCILVPPSLSPHSCACER